MRAFFEHDVVRLKAGLRQECFLSLRSWVLLGGTSARLLISWGALRSTQRLRRSHPLGPPNAALETVGEFDQTSLR